MTSEVGARKEGKDTTDGSYVKIGHKVYGYKCEWQGCGWHDANCDVHHIDYQEHNELEESQGEQLPKNNRSDNLAVLCPNHHRYVHSKNLGKKILDHIPLRRYVVIKL